jgi:2-methylisocitrate lyase-like PEP mutase family enzyme
MVTQADKGRAFRALHQRLGAFIIPNPWDPGSARLLTQRGFEALATTSAGFAFSMGQRDNTVGRDLMIAHVAAIVSATELPVSADLENGYGDDTAAVAETIRRAAAAGAVGGSIEDATGRPADPLYEIPLAAERIAAAAEIVRGLDVPFILTARAENYLVGRPDLAETITRLQSYQAAGADVLYAPGLTSARDIASVVASLDRPVNVLAGLTGMTLTLADLSSIGVRRVSVGSLLSRVALGAFLRAASELSNHGTFSFAGEAAPYRDLDEMFD